MFLTKTFKLNNDSFIINDYIGIDFISSNDGKNDGVGIDGLSQEKIMDFCNYTITPDDIDNIINMNKSDENVFSFSHVYPIYYDYKNNTMISFNDEYHKTKISYDYGKKENTNSFIKYFDFERKYDEENNSVYKMSVELVFEEKNIPKNETPYTNLVEAYKKAFNPKIFFYQEN